MTASSLWDWCRRSIGQGGSKTFVTGQILPVCWGLRTWLPNFAGFCVAVRTVAEHLKENGQYLLFETGQETPVTMLRCFEQVGCDNLGINLDTANLILYGKANPVDALDVFGRYVRNLHAKDGLYPVNGRELGTEAKIGEGKVDFRALFTRLHELGYDSHVTIERSAASSS